MEGKFELQFENNEYYLVDGNTNDTVATTDKVLLKEYDGYMKKLSLKNCEAVTNGYDLDELADEYVKPLIVSTDKRMGHWWGFMMGFEKALEILGDKKFSEDDMINAHYNAWIDRGEQITYPESRNRYFKSLQQTEWDVEIVTKPFVSVGLIIADFSGDTPVDILNVKKEVVEEGYALDADGCLILTKKKS